MGLVFGVATQAYAGAQVLQIIILLMTGTNAGGGYFAPKGVFVAIYIGLTFIWAVLNTFAIEIIAYFDVASIFIQIVGGTVIVVMLPLVAPMRQSASYVFGNFVTNAATTGVPTRAYAFVMSMLMSQYSLYGKPKSRIRPVFQAFELFVEVYAPDVLLKGFSLLCQ